MHEERCSRAVTSYATSSAIPRRKSITLHAPQSNLGKSCKTSTDWAYAIIRYLLTGLPGIFKTLHIPRLMLVTRQPVLQLYQLSRQHPCLRDGQTGLGRAPLAESSSHDALIGQVTYRSPQRGAPQHQPQNHRSVGQADPAGIGKRGVTPQ
jgi:hypothetical protein